MEDVSFDCVEQLAMQEKEVTETVAIMNFFLKEFQDKVGPVVHPAAEFWML